MTNRFDIHGDRYSAFHIKSATRTRQYLIWAFALTVSTLASSCERARIEDQPAPSLQIASVDRLRDGDGQLLARAGTASESPRGEYVIADRLDKNIKIYASNGEQRSVVGRAGLGPGEFEFLGAAYYFRDRVIALDLVRQELSTFNLEGRLAESRKLEPPGGGRFLELRTMDDSLLLLLSAPSVRAGKLIHLVNALGTVKEQVFDRRSYFADAASISNFTVVLADGHQGIIFATLIGSDSLFAFTTSGDEAGKGAIALSHQEPLVSHRSIALRNGGTLRHPDGSWSAQGVSTVMAVVALPDSMVALQVIPYAPEDGLDRMNGGRIVVMRLRASGRLDFVGAIASSAGLFGRAADGHALLIGFLAGESDSYAINHLVLDREGGHGTP